MTIDSQLSVLLIGNSLNSGDRFNPTIQRTPLLRPNLFQENVDMLEYPFFTINKFPSGFIVHIGKALCFLNLLKNYNSVYLK